MLADEYRLEDRVGDGSFGVVHRASRGGELFAVKTRKPSPGPGFQRTLDMMHAREVEALRAAGGHPNVLRLVDHDADRLVLEWCSKQTLCDVAGRWSRERCFRAADQLLSALAHVHAKGFLHRDVSARNVFLTLGGDVKLGDFGTARRSARAMTRVVCTLWYRHPKLIAGAGFWAEYGAEVDMWAAACCVAELFSGRAQFMGEDEASQLELIRRRGWVLEDSEVRALVMHRILGEPVPCT